MFNTASKTELCQISLTGVRAIVILGLLIKEPRTLEEIRNKMLEYGLLDKTNSNDILRIDLNTLRAAGCEISRANSKTDFKYKLSKHPFMFRFEQNEIDSIKQSYKKFSKTADIKSIVVFDKILKNIAEQTADEETKEQLYGISLLKSLDKKLISDLMEDCQNHSTVKLIYKNPASKKAYEKEVIAQQLVLNNDKLYLYAYKPDTQESVTLLVKRILQIIARTTGKKDNNYIKTTDVKFKLSKFGALGLENCETILEITENKEYIILGKYHNDFVAVQRILSFGSSCTVLEPEYIKQAVIDKLKKMRDIYDK